MVEIKLILNKKTIIPDNKQIRIPRYSILEIKTIPLHNKDYQIAISIDGINIFDGKHDDVFNSFKIKVKGEQTFNKWINNEKILFTQTNSDYSIANDGDPKTRGVIGIAIFENNELTTYNKIYYIDFKNKKNLPNPFKE